MEERRHDGTTRLTEKASRDDVARAFGDKRNAAVSLLAPGSRVARFRGGRRYVMIVQDDGSLLPEDPSPPDQEGAKE